jgi:predicted AlkP superfamily pyrophosphatase or phosphodiesterase
MVMRRLFGLILALSILAPASPVTTSAAPAAPRLVVMLVVDQMRNDYIDDYGASWAHGLRRLLSEGARFRNAAYPYFNTVTCAGHATIGTGTVPAFHGIILNQWWHREDQRERSCTDDPSAPTIPYGSGQPGGGHSATRLRVPTFAQTLDRAQGDRAHVVTMSMKARSAIMLAGGHADAVTWFEKRTFATSAAFSPARVAFVQKFIGASPVERDLGKTWDRLLPLSAYKYTDEGEGEEPTKGWTRVFPHSLGAAGGEASDAFYTQWASSPFADEYLERMAEAAIDAVPLGQGTATDYLGVSFSALDSVGHKFGPRSHEVQDMLARLDVTIGRLLDHLDARVGRGKYVVALSADHGVAVIPEQLKREGIDAGRAIMNAASARAQAALVHAFGPGEYVARMDYTNLFLMPGVFERLTRQAGALEAVMKAIEGTPGVLRVIDSRVLNPSAGTSDPLERATALGEFRGRSGDFIVLPRTNWIWVADDGTPAPGDATTHGTGYPYDTRVPLLLLGAGVKPGMYEGAATPADIAPTLARICGVALPTASGRSLDEAIAR